MQQNYKVGDLVECVDNSKNEKDNHDLTLRKLYKVLHIWQYSHNNFTTTIDDTGREGTFFFIAGLNLQPLHNLNQATKGKQT